MIILGIDPDVDKSGVCILDNGRIVLLKSMMIPELLLTLTDLHINAIVAIEDVEQRKATFKRQNMNAGQMQKIAQNVGMVKGAARQLNVLIKHLGYDPRLVPVGVGKQVKKDADLFKRVTGYTERTNEDTRDAWAIANYIYNEVKNG